MSGINRLSTIRRSKYGANKIETEDGRFDSKKEYKRWLFLLDQQEKGNISDLKRQVEFVLIPSHTLPRPYTKGKRKTVHRTELACKYKADFTYIRCGQLVVEDVKGFRTPEYIIKRKLMLDRFGIQIDEV